MAFITIYEILDIIVMTFAIGYIFSKFFVRTPKENYDPLKYYAKNSLLEDMKYGAIIGAPAVILHELAHKIAAISFGAEATLHAPDLMGIPYGWYILVIILMHLNFPFLFLVGGYVSHTALPALPSAIVAISGPLINIAMWLLCNAAVKYNWVHRKNYPTLGMIAKLNLFLFIFNILPFPGFDGYHFLSSLFGLFA